MGANECPVDTPRLLAGDLLLEDCRDECLDDPVRARDPDAGKPPRELHDDPMRRVEGEERVGVVVEPEEVGCSLDRPAGARSPGSRDELLTGVDGFDRRRAVGRPRGAPNPAGFEPDRRVAVAVAKRRQRPDELIPLGPQEPSLEIGSDAGLGGDRQPGPSGANVAVKWRRAGGSLTIR